MVEKSQYTNILKLVFKIVFSTAAVYYIVSHLDVKQVGNAIKEMNPAYIVYALVLYTISQIGSSFRLNHLFKAIDLNLRVWPNIKLYWLGMFYNFFLPGGVGGDGYKIFYLRKYFKAPVKKLLGAVFADRLSGLSIIVIYLLGLAYYIEYDLPYQGWVFLLIPLVSGGYYLFLWIFNRALTKAYWPVSLWSIVVQGLQMVAVICLLKGMGGQIKGHWDDYMFLFFLSTIASAIPITLGGIGARELVFMKGASLLGVNIEQAVAISLLFYLCTLVSALPGVYYAVRTNRIFGNMNLEYDKHINT